MEIKSPAFTSQIITPSLRTYTTYIADRDRTLTQVTEAAWQTGKDTYFDMIREKDRTLDGMQRSYDRSGQTISEIAEARSGYLINTMA